MLHTQTIRAWIAPAVAALVAAIVAAIVTLWPATALAQAATGQRLTLGELTALAQKGPRAEMARQETRVARARLDEARGAAWPRLSMTALVAPSPEITCENADCTRTTPTDFELALQGVLGTLRISAVQPVYTFGKLGAIERAARAGAQAVSHLEDALAGDLAVDAARAYYGLKLARELVWMLEDGLAEIDKALERLEERLGEGSGEVTVQDRLRVETLRAEVKARLSEARQAEAIALAGVRELSGKLDADIDEEPLAAVTLEVGELGAYLVKAQSERAEVKAADQGARAARAKREFEWAHYFPDVVVVGDVSVGRAQGADDPPSIYANDPFNTTSAALGLALRWQLDPMMQRARVSQARARARQAEALADLARTGARFEVRAAHAEATQAKARLAASEEGQKSARGWVAAVLQAEAVGTAESKDLADAFIAYFTLQARYVTSIYEWNLATVRLRRAVGEFTAARERP